MPETKKDEIISTLKLAQVKGVSVAARESGVSAPSIKGWGKRAGVTFPHDAPKTRNWDDIRSALK